MIVSRFHRIPIYDHRLWIGVADNIDDLHNKFEWAFGKNEGGQIACLSFHRSKFGLFFERKEICHDVIAHEVWHATNRMMEQIGHYVSGGPNEPHTFLCGYLTGLVYQDLAGWKIPVKLSYRITPMRFVRE